MELLIFFVLDGVKNLFLDELGALEDLVCYNLGLELVYFVGDVGEVGHLPGEEVEWLWG